MPRPGPRRPLIAVRFSQDDIDAIDRLAAECGVNRSEMIRELVTLGRRTLGDTPKRA